MLFYHNYLPGHQSSLLHGRKVWVYVLLAKHTHFCSFCWVPARVLGRAEVWGGCRAAAPGRWRCDNSPSAPSSYTVPDHVTRGPGHPTWVRKKEIDARGLNMQTTPTSSPISGLLQASMTDYLASSMHSSSSTSTGVERRNGSRRGTMGAIINES